MRVRRKGGGHARRRRRHTGATRGGDQKKARRGYRREGLGSRTLKRSDYFVASRIVSFAEPTAFCTVPLALSALPSA